MVLKSWFLSHGLSVSPSLAGAERLVQSHDLSVQKLSGVENADTRGFSDGPF